MKILSIDTASEVCGVSILEDSDLICNLDQNLGKTHSENLMPMIKQALETTNLKLKDFDLIVCDKGPGSFTGIRIGIATVKAFYDSLSIPCIGISSLEALAYSIKEEGFIMSILDCKNGNCYFALYEHTTSQYTQILSPTATTVENALSQCQQMLSKDTPIMFVGNGSILFEKEIHQKFKNYLLATPQNNSLNSYYLGLVGLTKFKKNELKDVLPFYLKKPQAQKQLEDTSKATKITFMTQEDLTSISDTLASDFDEFWSYRILKDELEANNSHYLVAKLDSKIVGFAGIKTMVEESDIMNIVIRKDFRNQGIGSLLLEKLIDLSKEQNVTSITLEVMEENYSAIHLYKKFGFHQIGIRKNYYQNKNAIIMAKKVF